jgi:hypothetical protein
VLNRGIREEGVAKPMSGADESWRSGWIPKGPANLADEIRQIGLGNERLGPQSTLQNRLGNHLWTINDERQQQLERLGREVNLAVFLGELSGVEVENKWAEANPHGPPCEIPAKFLTVP